jgi:hypothetical protein
MAKEDIDEAELEVDLEEIEDIDDLPVDDADDDLEDAVIEDADEELEVVDSAAVKKAESDDDDDDVPDADDVEASLDVILKERLVVEDEPEDEEVADADDRAEGVERVLPKQSDEFVCTSCFLVKHANQRADPKKDVCRDCV